MIEERLKNMVVLAVDNGDIDGPLGKFGGGCKAAKASADDYDVRSGLDIFAFAVLEKMHANSGDRHDWPS